MGVVKVMVAPEIEAICLTSAVGRSSRENQDPAVPGVVGNSPAAKSSMPGRTGLCFCQTTRQSEAAQIWPRPCGSVRQPAPEASSSKTIWPAANPAVLATVTADAPFTASAVRLVEATTSLGLPVVEYRDGPTMINGEGLALTDSSKRLGAVGLRQRRQARSGTT